MAAVTAPEPATAQHQSLLHFVGEGRWSDTAVLANVRKMALLAIERNGPIESWIMTTRAFLRRAPTRCVWRGNIAASSSHIG